MYNDVLDKFDKLIEILEKVRTEQGEMRIAIANLEIMQHQKKN